MPLNPNVIAEIRQAAQQAQPPQQTTPQGSKILRTLMMLMQGADSLNTANFLQGKPGRYETDPLMKPFAQAGNPGPMLGAYGAEDRAIGALPSAGKQNNASLLQILFNLAGILQTQRARHSP